MDKKMGKLFKQFDKLRNALFGVLTVYGPKTINEIADSVLYYFPELDEICDDSLKIILDELVHRKELEKSKKEYSVIPFDLIKNITAVSEMYNRLPVGSKEFSGKEILSFGSNENLINRKEFRSLKNYFESIVKDKEILMDVLCFITFLPYLFVEEKEAYEIACDKVKGVDERKFVELYDEYFSSVPRFFFGGYSFKEHNELLIKMYPDEFVEKKDNLIKKYPSKKNYPHFNYSDLIELGKEISKTKIYKLIDSDRILELTVNGKKVYAQILGFYGKDIGIIIYPNKEEMMYTYHFAMAEQQDYPDIALRFNNIEVCLNDPGGFANDEVLYDMKVNNYPEFPSFIRLETNHNNRLVNDEEIQIVGGVLSDLLTYIQTNNLSDISLHLGEKNNQSYDIDQLYVTEKETLYGGYYEIELDDAFLNFKNEPVDKNIIKKIKKLNKRDISIGCYVYPAIIDNDELPYMIIVRDDVSGIIIDMFLKRLSEMPNIKNDLLNVLIQHQVCPDAVHVVNEYTFEIFDEFAEYFKDYWFVDDDELNNIYKEVMDFEGFQDTKVDKKKLN